MKLLLDENLPYSLAKEPPDHECASVVTLDWRGTQDGPLLLKAEEHGFEVLITLDEDMLAEQNLDGHNVSILVLKPKKQGKRPLIEMVGQIDEAVAHLAQGEAAVIRQAIE